MLAFKSPLWRVLFVVVVMFEERIVVQGLLIG
jgi:hypothetical protein